VGHIDGYKTDTKKKILPEKAKHEALYRDLFGGFPEHKSNVIFYFLLVTSYLLFANY
jgi:hypothetical protein